jgi:hypothetical protein
MKVNSQRTDDVLALLEATVSFEKQIRGTLPLDVDDASVRDAAEARWQIHVGSAAGDEAAFERADITLNHPMPEGLFSSSDEFYRFCTEAIPLDSSETFVQTSASTRWEMAFGSPSTPLATELTKEPLGDALATLLTPALWLDGLIAEEVDLGADEAAVNAAAEERWSAFESQDHQSLVTELDAMSLRKMFGGKAAVDRFLDAKIPLDSIGIKPANLQKAFEERWSAAGLPTPAHLALLSDGESENVHAEPISRKPADPNSPKGWAHDIFARYFGNGGAGFSNVGFPHRFGLYEEKLNKRALYVLLSDDWQPDEIFQQDAKHNSFNAIRPNHIFKRILRGIFSWLVEDSAQYPGTRPFEFAIVGTNPEQDPGFQSRRQRLRLKRDRADLTLIRLPSGPSQSSVEVDLEVAISMGRPNVFVLAENLESESLGLPSGFAASVFSANIKDWSVNLALSQAKDIIRWPGSKVSEFLRHAKRGAPEEQFCAWIVLIYLYTRDLACRRSMIDGLEIAAHCGVDAFIGKGDPLLGDVIKHTPEGELPYSLELRSVGATRRKLAATS